jgi:hypothetical protein
MEIVLLVDFNNLLFRTLFAKDVAIKTPNPNYDLWRYLLYESVYLQIKHIRATEVVLAVDDPNSWRKSYFSRYKESRKSKREKQELDWKFVFNEMDSYLRDLKHHMPFKVIKVRSAEADDVIAVIAQTMSSGEKCVISSNDEDYLQLCSKKVKIWNPTKRKFVHHNRPRQFLLEKILMGQSKDDIFNVKTPSDYPVGKRKPPMGPETVKKVLAGDVKKWLRENDYVGNFKRNQVLIDFNHIPVTIKNRVLDAYDQYNFPPPKNIYPFFKKYKMRGYQEDFHRVEATLMKLY